MKLIDIQKAAIAAEMQTPSLNTLRNIAENSDWKPIDVTVEQELDDAGDEETMALREKQREVIVNTLNLSQ